MKRWLFALVLLGMVGSAGRAAMADSYVEYYRDNLFLGLAYHRVGCLTDWNTIRSDQDYDGFTTNRYCRNGASAASVPSGSWYDYQYLSTSQSNAQSRLDSCGSRTNSKYATPNYAARSNSCSYNVVSNCNSDCWIRYFSTCSGHRVGTFSPCFGYSYP